MESQPEYQFCPNCGKPNRVSAKFCGVCGKPLVASSATPSPPQVSNASAATGDGVTQESSTIEAEAIAAPPPNESSHSTEPDKPPAIDAPPAPIAPTTLSVGAKLHDRYEVVQVLEPMNGTMRYRVKDALRCSNCQSENQVDEAYCSTCGREMGTTRGTCLLEAIAAPQDMSGAPLNSFVAGDQLYVIQPDPPKADEKKPFAQGVQLTYGCRSDAGMARREEPDEDSVFTAVFSSIYEATANPSVGLFIVADGIGGSDAGEVASKACIQAVVAYLTEKVVARALAGEQVEDDAARQEIKSAIQAGNVRVCEIAKEKQSDLGTTITLALVVNERAYIANAGDSRTYLLSGAGMKQISKDHSLVAKLVAAGEIQPEEIYTHPQRNYILRSLGANPEIEIDIFPTEGGAIMLQPGMRLVLCSDGLWEMVRDEDIERQLLMPNDPQSICNELVKQANAAGGDDNISVVIVKVD